MKSCCMVYDKLPKDISLGLAKQKSKAMKLKALKVQLNFRKRVLEQIHENKEIFLYHQKSQAVVSI